MHRLELATGLPFGADEPLYGGPRGGAAGDPRAALSARIAPALERTPCCVSFSGGRDSSAVLALATAVARREGLPDPVPVTLRFSGIASTEESSWQQLVVDHLRLKEWEVITIDEELDLLGEIARQTLATHGLMWPPNAYIHVPILDRAVGGCVLTGLDGDGLFGGWRWSRVAAVLRARVRPVPRDVLRVGLALAPQWVRRPVMREPLVAALPWLRPAVRRQVGEAVRADAAAEPLRWDRRLAHYACRRYLRLTVHSLKLLGASRGVELIHPLLDPGFLAALARHGGAAGYGERTAAMRALFADVLPEALLSRGRKAEFGAAIWRSQARAFAEAWNGAGLDLALVDPAQLRRAWRAPSPLFGSSTLLHAAWLRMQTT